MPMPARLIETLDRQLRRAGVGVQNKMILAEAPAAAAALLGQPLEDITITVDGDYVVIIPISGLTTELQCHVVAQLDAMTLTWTGPSALLMFEERSEEPSTAVVSEAGSASATSISDNTLTSATLTTIRGERYARLTFTAAGAPTSVTFDRAEYNGI